VDRVTMRMIESVRRILLRSRSPETHASRVFYAGANTDELQEFEQRHQASLVRSPALRGYERGFALALSLAPPEGGLRNAAQSRILQR
jgi:hypothetical protein